MNPVFNEKKAAQMAAKFVKLSGGSIKHLLLIKLMYLSDRLSLLEKGRTITGDKYVSMQYGPVLSRVYNLIKEDSPSRNSPWYDYIKPGADFSVNLAVPDREPETDSLSKYELTVLDKVFKTYGHFDQFKLAELTHEICPEWVDPGRSSFPIPIENILRAEGVPEKEITEIEEEQSSSEFLDLLAKL